MFVYVLLIVLALSLAANAQYNTTLGQSACNAFNNNCVSCIQYANGDNMVCIYTHRVVDMETNNFYKPINLYILLYILLTVMYSLCIVIIQVPVHTCSFCHIDGICHAVGSLFNKCNNDQCVSLCGTSSCKMKTLDGCQWPQKQKN